MSALYKTKEQLDEMRRLNPHLAEEFLDSPIVSNPSLSNRIRNARFISKKRGGDDQSTQNAGVSKDFNRKYESNSLLESRERSIKKATLRKQKLSEIPLEKYGNKAFRNSTQLKKKNAVNATQKAQSIGAELANIYKLIPGIISVSLFLFTIHYFFVITFGLVALLGFGLEIAAVDFFSWIPIVGELVGKIVSSIIPGMVVGSIALMIAAILGWGSCIAILLQLEGIGHWKPPPYFILILVLCFGCYVIPGLQLLPWYGLIVVVAILDMLLTALKKK